MNHSDVYSRETAVEDSTYSLPHDGRRNITELGAPAQKSKCIVLHLELLESYYSYMLHAAISKRGLLVLSSSVGSPVIQNDKHESVKPLPRSFHFSMLAE